jgi:hypothetical protein
MQMFEVLSLETTTRKLFHSLTILEEKRLQSLFTPDPSPQKNSKKREITCGTQPTPMCIPLQLFLLIESF